MYSTDCKDYLTMVYLLTLKVESKLLTMEEPQQCKTEVEDMDSSIASLKEKCAAVLETLNKSSSKSSIKSEASMTSVNSKMGPAVSLSSDCDDSPKVCGIHVPRCQMLAMNASSCSQYIEDGTPAT